MPNWAFLPPMIDRHRGEDADLIIEQRWPDPYNEDQLQAVAQEHREQAQVISNDARPHLVAAHHEATTRNAGALADRSAEVTQDHIGDNECSEARHLQIANEVESFAKIVISSKNQINGAVDTFTAAWAQAPQLARENNWYQHDYNKYRSELVRAGRDTVTSALSDLFRAHEALRNTLHMAF